MCACADVIVGNELSRCAASLAARRSACASPQMSKQGTAITQSRRYSAEPGRRHEHCLHLLGSVGSALSAARLAQSVERKAVNLVVVGLSPTVGDFSFVLYFTLSFLEDCTFSFAEDTSTVYMLLKVHQAVAISSPSSSVGRAQGS
ncbi:hypothetical protein PVAP13_5KG516700 [Panicum virgatum]|uniref:Uncharacterized protein n=1 Tax=Panicum virgatum TaxID=38727 RepID=A0A8T0SP16_PANVG|nr:hypothetical protein PVAP13_5KG516700 [Panicum virgatum]